MANCNAWLTIKLDLAHLGALLMNLSIPDSVQQPPLTQQSNAPDQEITGFAETVKRVALELDEEFRNITPVIILSGALMQVGWLHSIPDFENYLLSVLKVMLPSHRNGSPCRDDNLTV